MGFDWFDGDPMLGGWGSAVAFSLIMMGTRLRLLWEDLLASLFLMAIDDRRGDVEGAPVVNQNDWTWTKAASIR